MCGEGGEYETLTLNCPLFKKRIVMYVVSSIAAYYNYRFRFKC